MVGSQPSPQILDSNEKHSNLLQYTIGKDLTKDQKKFWNIKPQGPYSKHLIY